MPKTQSVVLPKKLEKRIDELAQALHDVIHDAAASYGDRLLARFDHHFTSLFYHRRGLNGHRTVVGNS